MRVEPFAQRGPDEAHGLAPGSVGVSQALFSVRRAVEGPALGVGSACVDLPAEAAIIALAGTRRCEALAWSLGAAELLYAGVDQLSETSAIIADHGVRSTPDRESGSGR